MDRNLGASQVATSSTDSAAYGDLYQWGRGADGHQIRTSATTTTTSSTDDPGHGDFITINVAPTIGGVPQNDNLWQGVSGTNNPCPAGFRLPTDAEWETERVSWSSNNPAGAFASPLKLVMAGSRHHRDGAIIILAGLYWSSHFSGHLLLFNDSGYANMGYSEHAYGHSVRCIKD